MATPTLEITVLPPEKPLDDLVSFLSRKASRRSELIGPDGRKIALPPEVFRVLSAVVEAMARGQAVTVAPHNLTLTTQEAADILGVSRPTLIRLLDAGRLPYRQPGRHRRILLQDVLEYNEVRRSERSAALGELVAVSEEAGLYEATADPKRTR